MRHTVALIASPEKSMFDEQIRIRIKGLATGNAVTIAATCSPSTNIAATFLSYAHYVANEDGAIDIETMASVGGSYVGVEPMGLLWSLTSTHDDENERNKHFKAISYPDSSFPVELFVIEGHVNPICFLEQLHLHSKPLVENNSSDADKNDPSCDARQVDNDKSIQEMKKDEKVSNCNILAHQTIRRFTVSPTTTRQTIREGKLRGALFTPTCNKLSVTGDQRYPALLVLGGAAPGLHEITASVLASHGYVTLTLAYSGYDDLPSERDLELEYFLDALDFMASLENVDNSKIGIYGYCLGGSLSLHLAIVSSLVKAVVTVNTCSYLMLGKVSHKGEPLFVYRDSSKMKRNEIGSIIFGDTLPILDDDKSIPIEQANKKVTYLLLHGEDDNNVPFAHSLCLGRRMKEAGRGEDCTVVTYPGAGHALFVPYTIPFPWALWLFGEKADKIYLGGETYAHTRASQKAWQTTLTFLTNRLKDNCMHT